MCYLTNKLGHVYKLSPFDLNLQGRIAESGWKALPEKLANPPECQFLSAAT